MKRGEVNSYWGRKGAFQKMESRQKRRRDCRTEGSLWGGGGITFPNGKRLLLTESSRRRGVESGWALKTSFIGFPKELPVREKKRKVPGGKYTLEEHPVRKNRNASLCSHKGI